MDYIIAYIIGVIVAFVLFSILLGDPDDVKLPEPIYSVLPAAIMWPVCLVIIVGVIIYEGSNRLSKKIYRIFHWRK